MLGIKLKFLSALLVFSSATNSMRSLAKIQTHGNVNFLNYFTYYRTEGDSLFLQAFHPPKYLRTELKTSQNFQTLL